MQSSNSLVVVLLVAALQTAGAMGDITAVARAVPALRVIADALDWVSLPVSTICRKLFCILNPDYCTAFSA